jgi:DNA-binding MarR family transcriptional regulator
METALDMSVDAGEDRPAAEPRWLTADEQRAWRGWLALSGLLQSQVGSDLLSETGLSTADYQVLVNLSEAPDRRLRMTELASRIDWSKSRLSHQFARMEARGLVKREECPSDARGAFAVLTDQGMSEIVRAAPFHVESVRRHFIDLLQPSEVQQIERIAAKVVDHLRTQSVGDRFPPEAFPEVTCLGGGSGADSLDEGGDEPDHGDSGTQG